MNLKFDFTGKQVVVTGGARGIGFAVTRAFLDAGASVAVWDFSEDSLAAAKAETKSATDRVSFSLVDVASSSSVAAAAAAMGSVDILINNAGITRDKSFAKMTDDDFDAVIATNLRGVYNVTHTLLPKFTAASGKRIISISSVVALYGNFGQTNYVAAKAGVIGMTKTWSRELARKGFTANAIAPGFTRTPMVEAMPADVLSSMSERVPTGRLGEPRDIANACLFLASEEASYITGTVLSVDGGLVC